MAAVVGRQGWGCQPWDPNTWLCCAAACPQPSPAGEHAPRAVSGPAKRTSCSPVSQLAAARESRESWRSCSASQVPPPPARLLQVAAVLPSEEDGLLCGREPGVGLPHIAVRPRAAWPCFLKAVLGPGRACLQRRRGTLQLSLWVHRALGARPAELLHYKCSSDARAGRRGVVKHS